jgi:hypothetical protein
MIFTLSCIEQILTVSYIVVIWVNLGYDNDSCISGS